MKTKILSQVENTFGNKSSNVDVWHSIEESHFRKINIRGEWETFNHLIFVVNRQQYLLLYY